LYIFYRDSLKSQDSNFRLVRFYNLPLDSLGFTGWGFIANGMANFPNSLTHIVQIAASDHHVIYLNTAGKVIGQGYNYNNVLDIPANLDSVVDISSRFYHNLALLSNGKVVAWGSGTDTIISNPNYLQSIVPDSVEHIVQIAAGGFHSLALDKNGNIFAWGSGSTKTNNLDSLAYGQSIVPTNKKFTKISAGLYHSVAIRSDSIISVWGAGDSLKYITNNYQQSIIDSNKNNKIIDISAGYFHTLVLRADSTCFSFGDNTVDQQLIPDSINKNIVQISAGGLHNSILKSDSSLFQWGYGIYNPKQYYAIYTLNSYIPFFFHGVPEFGQAIVPASLTHNVAYISSGGYTNIALNYLSIKTAVNSFGSISNSIQVKAHNNYTITYSPYLGFVFDYLEINGVKYYESTSSYTFNNVTKNQQINAYFIPDTSCILYNLDRAIYRSKDTLRFKGFNVEKIEIRKHLFDSTPLILSYIDKTPLSGFDTLYKFALPDSLNNQVFIVRGYNFRDTANRFYLFRIDDRSLDSFGLVGWGRNQEQQLIVPDSVFNVTQFECALFTNIALRRDGKCFVWSRNIYEELEIPAGAENIVSVSAGGYHFLALKNDGTVFIWGNNDRDQQNIPDSGNNNATLISTSRYTSIVQKINNSVFGWYKSGDSLDFNTYIGVLNISQPFNYTKILGGEYHYLAYDKDSFLYSWGINKTSYYNFNAAYNEAIIPASLKNAAGLAKVNGFDAALYNSMVIKPDSTVFIWGPNFNNVNSVPSNIRSIVKVSIGFSNPLALDKNGNIWNNWGDNSYNLQKQPKKLKYATDIGTGFYHDFVQNRIYIISEIDTGEISPFIFLKYGDTFKVTYSPPIGYKTDSVVINDNLLSNDSIKSYTFKRVKRYQYLRVTTQRIRDTIFTSAVNGSIVGNQYKFYGDTVLITYSPNIGYEIDSIFIDGIFVKDTTRDSVNSFTFYYLTASHTFRVVFKKIQFEVKTAINNGFITPTSDVDSNSNFTINYKAATGHYIDSVFINGIFKPELITDSSYVFRNILGDSNIRVHTKAFVYNIFTEIINGNITPDSITYYDSIFMVTYLPKVGYQIDSVFINNIYREELQNTLQYRFSKVLGDSSISIKTKRLQFRISTQIFNG
ncbi:MAG: hypothetical protein ORN85_01500, partial [Sediminibacterium sp.]|nr:hypothetical protein [Sediminibacterium sp.]